MKNYEAEKLKKIIVSKENAMIAQITETDELRKENLILKAQLTQYYAESYNKALNDLFSECVKLGTHYNIVEIDSIRMKLLKGVSDGF